MVAHDTIYSARTGHLSRSLRIATSAALLGVMLGGCSSVPDAVNPAKWYEKTTDFFAGDTQAAGATPAPSEGDNQGLAADPNAPAPAAAPGQQVSNAPSGLSGDQASSNYASPPIERQSAATDMLRPEPPIGAAPPVPAAQPVMPVMSAPTPAPTTPTMPMAEAPTPPSSGTLTAPSSMSMLPDRPASMSMEGAPPPPVFNAPANAQSPFGGDTFETVVISSDGMDTLPQQTLAPSRSVSAQPQGGTGAMFPEPGATTSGQVGALAPSGFTRVATIHFANNASELDARDRSILGAVVQLQHERGGRVVVVGHASSRTNDMDYVAHQMVNFQISMERAATIGDALKGMGLGGDALEVQAVSDATPLYMEVMPSGEAGNRRVEIYLAL